MGIKGLAVDDGWLSVVGSQTFKRSKAENGVTSAEAMPEPAGVSFCAVSRWETEDGPPPIKCDGTRHTGYSTLTSRDKVQKLLAGDRLQEAFQDPLSTGNGFDIEGIAVGHATLGGYPTLTTGRST